MRLCTLAEGYVDIDRPLTTHYWPNGKTSLLSQVVGFEGKAILISLHFSDLELANWLIN